MSRSPRSLRPSLPRARRRTRLTLERELAGYSSAAELNDLELIVEAGQAADGGEVATLLRQQAHRRLFRTR
ncbi:hypothetical protein [Geodermatophilus sp. DSM 45219]|uniref:hypothetical protein n=1 Tax=Geodermatophilus sp. DSM 45219 TaxID=1881103 RepID=UPI000891BD63|nr:hypothetical protein [Geodermatophilus sp. DSM 45219]SDN97281.1 hypothetical protein SAMN05428965_2175 [Geodermatophilus sp. DSM 45219]